MCSYCEEMLKVLPDPKNVWKYMLAVTQIPRGSNKGDEMFRHLKIRNFLKEQAEKLGCETYVDKGENLIVRKAATPGYEDKPVICFQGHMDMVPEKDAGSTHNFLTDGLTLSVEDGWIRADRTTLGGDDGVAVAMMLALLDGAPAPHPALECLFTVSEETGMRGHLTPTRQD